MLVGVRLVKRVVLSAVLALLVLYAGDYLSVRFRIPGNREPLGSVDIQVYYAVGLKGHKVEYMRGDPQTQTCAHSLFPQLGYSPCWYVNRHTRKWIDVGRLRRRMPGKRPWLLLSGIAGVFPDLLAHRFLEHGGKEIPRSRGASDVQVVPPFLHEAQIAVPAQIA